MCIPKHSLRRTQINEYSGLSSNSFDYDIQFKLFKAIYNQSVIYINNSQVHNSQQMFLVYCPVSNRHSESLVKA